MVMGTYACNSATESAAPEAAAAAAAPVDPRSLDVGIQLYGLRDEMAKSIPDTLKKVSDLGYRFVELADYADGKFYGLEPADFKRMVDDAGLEIPSSHSQVESTGISLDDAKVLVDAHAALGVKYCIYPWVEEVDRNLDFYHGMVDELNQIGQMMKDAGIQFGYHNHNFDFATIDGVVPYYDIFLKDMDPELITFELDLYWATKAGQDPVEMFNQYPGRFQLFHMKDMKAVTEPFFEVIKDDICPVGTGEIDLKRIIANKETAGNQYVFVEDDNQGNGFGFWSAKNSIENIVLKEIIS